MRSMCTHTKVHAFYFKFYIYCTFRHISYCSIFDELASSNMLNAGGGKLSIQFGDGRLKNTKYEPLGYPVSGLRVTLCFSAAESCALM